MDNWRPSVYKVFFILFSMCLVLITASALVYSLIENWVYVDSLYFCFIRYLDARVSFPNIFFQFCHNRLRWLCFESTRCDKDEPRRIPVCEGSCWPNNRLFVSDSSTFACSLSVPASSTASPTSPQSSFDSFWTGWSRRWMWKLKTDHSCVSRRRGDTWDWDSDRRKVKTLKNGQVQRE